MRKIWMPVLVALSCLPTVVQAAAGVMEGGPGCGLGLSETGPSPRSAISPPARAQLRGDHLAQRALPCVS